MTDSTTITVRLDRELRNKLEQLAKSTRRSKSFLAAEAIAEYVELNAWQIEQIEQAVAEADAGGPFVPHEDVERWAMSLGTANELPRPKGTRRP
jgi:predicted transcriptional regulator